MHQSTLKISKELKNLALLIDSKIQEISGERIGFSLIIYTQQRASYISNCKREVTIKELKTLIEHWENEMPDIPAHEYQD